MLRARDLRLQIAKTYSLEHEQFLHHCQTQHMLIQRLMNKRDILGADHANNALLEEIAHAEEKWIGEMRMHLAERPNASTGLRTGLLPALATLQGTSTAVVLS